MAQFQVVAKYIMRNKNGGGFGLLFNSKKQRTMQKAILLMVVALFLLHTYAIKLNQRGEKWCRKSALNTQMVHPFLLAQVYVTKNA